MYCHHVGHVALGSTLQSRRDNELGLTSTHVRKGVLLSHRHLDPLSFYGRVGGTNLLTLDRLLCDQQCDYTEF